MQARLLEISMRLNPGQAIVIPRDDMYKAALGMLTGLDRMSGARESDVVEFAEIISKNWDVKLTENMMSGDYVMFKPKEHNGEL